MPAIPPKKDGHSCALLCAAADNPAGHQRAFQYCQMLLTAFKKAQPLTPRLALGHKLQARHKCRSAHQKPPNQTRSTMAAGKSCTCHSKASRWHTTPAIPVKGWPSGPLVYCCVQHNPLGHQRELQYCQMWARTLKPWLAHGHCGTSCQHDTVVPHVAWPPRAGGQPVPQKCTLTASTASRAHGT